MALDDREKQRRHSERLLRNLQTKAQRADEDFREEVRSAAEGGLFSRRELGALLDLSTTTVQRIVSGKP